MEDYNLRYELFLVDFRTPPPHVFCLSLNNFSLCLNYFLVICFFWILSFLITILECLNHFEWILVFRTFIQMIDSN